MLSSRTHDRIPQLAVLLAIGTAALLLLTRIAHADVGAPATVAGIDWSLWSGVVVAVLTLGSYVLHALAAKSHSATLEAIASDIDTVRLMAKGAPESPLKTVKPRDLQAGTSVLGVLAALTVGGVIAAAIACTASQARQSAAAGVVAALDCEAAHLDAQALADARMFADAKVLQWLAGALAPNASKIKADLAPIKSDLGRCAIAGALAAATAILVPTPGTAVSALSTGDPMAARASFSVAARVLGWAPVRLADGTVL